MPDYLDQSASTEVGQVPPQEPRVGKVPWYKSKDSLPIALPIIASVGGVVIAIVAQALAKTDGWTNVHWAILWGLFLLVVGTVLVRSFLKEIERTIYFWVAFFLILLGILGTAWIESGGAPEMPKLTQTSAPSPAVRTVSDTVTITEPGNYNFELEPFDQTGSWILVGTGLKLRMTASADTPYHFFMKLKSGSALEVGNPAIKFPDQPGAFKLVAGERRVKISLLVTR